MIKVEYIETGQLCRLVTDTNDAKWKQIRLHYTQISDQAGFSEDIIELPWHTFIANLRTLSEIETVFGIELTLSPIAEEMILLGVKERSDINSIDEIERLAEGDMQALLEARGFNPDRRLTAQQKRNLAKLSRMPYGATFSVPGAGKTTEAISFFLLHRKADEKLVVICPKNAFPAWEEQIKVCIRNRNINVKRLIQGCARIANELIQNIDDVYLISYQQFNRCSQVLAKYLHKNKVFVFVDESHRIKGGGKTDTGRRIQSIAHLPIGKLVM